MGKRSPSYSTKYHTTRIDMNRKKKMNTTLKNRTKKEKAKRAPKTKSSYISKAKRTEMEAETNEPDNIADDAG
jgi:hypothetical protein